MPPAGGRSPLPAGGSQSAPRQKRKGHQRRITHTHCHCHGGQIRLIQTEIRLDCCRSGVRSAPTRTQTKNQTLTNRQGRAEKRTRAAIHIRTIRCYWTRSRPIRRTDRPRLLISIVNLKCRPRWPNANGCTSRKRVSISLAVLIPGSSFQDVPVLRRPPESRLSHAGGHRRCRSSRGDSAPVRALSPTNRISFYRLRSAAMSIHRGCAGVWPSSDSDPLRRTRIDSTARLRLSHRKSRAPLFLPAR